MSTVGSQIFRRYARYAVVALVDGPSRAAARRRARHDTPARPRREQSRAARKTGR